MMYSFMTIHFRFFFYLAFILSHKTFFYFEGKIIFPFSVEILLIYTMD